MSESSRHAYVIPIKLEKHPNADLLSIVKIDGFQCIVNTEQWKDYNTAVYIEPESIVKTDRPEFNFLKRGERKEEVIRAKRLRQEWSLGLLVPTPEGFNIGDDCWDYLELRHYEPDDFSNGISHGDCATPPKHWGELGKYDLENWKRYKGELVDGELVNLTIKYHGAFWSATYSDGEFHVKSRGFWRKNDGNDYWAGLLENEQIKKYLVDNPNTLVCGELIGKVQKGFSYGIPAGKVGVRLFDIRKPDYHYLEPKQFFDVVSDNDLPCVCMPNGLDVLVPYSEELILQHCEGQQPGCNHIREGIVIRTEKNRYSSKINGRVILKCVSNTYLEKQGK